MSFWVWSTVVIVLFLGIRHYLYYYCDKNISGKVILITGCDTGFGNLTAKKLDTKGVIVFATCLTEAGAERLNSETSSNCHVHIMDVTRPLQVKEVSKKLKHFLDNHNRHLYGLVNNAGITFSGPFESIPEQRFNHVLQVNLLGSARVTREFLPLMRGNYKSAAGLGKESRLIGLLKYWLFRGVRGRIVNVASMAGRAALPGTSPYFASKFGVIGLSESIRMEFEILFHIWVATIEPAFTNTPIITSITPELYQKTWKEELGKDTLSTYDTDKLCGLICEIKKQGLALADPPNTAVDDIITALSAYCPKRNYYPTNSAHFLAFLCYCPTFVAELLGITSQFDVLSANN